MLSRHEVDLRRAFLDVNIPILVHILRFDDLLCAILFEEQEQFVQLDTLFAPAVPKVRFIRAWQMSPSK